VLGGGHAVAKQAAELARANLSSAGRAALVEAERAREARAPPGASLWRAWARRAAAA
jgi:hypothetical protein